MDYLKWRWDICEWQSCREIETPRAAHLEIAVKGNALKWRQAVKSELSNKMVFWVNATENRRRPGCLIPFLQRGTTSHGIPCLYQQWKEMNPYLSCCGAPLNILWWLRSLSFFIYFSIFLWSMFFKIFVRVSFHCLN